MDNKHNFVTAYMVATAKKLATKYGKKYAAEW